MGKSECAGSVTSRWTSTQKVSERETAWRIPGSGKGIVVGKGGEFRWVSVGGREEKNGK